MEKIFPKSFFEGDRSVSKVASASSKNTQGLTDRQAFQKGAIALRFTGQTPALCSGCYALILKHGVEAAIQKWGVRKGNPIRPAGGVQARYDLIIINFDQY